jgi:hypothetical protein
MSHQRLRHVSAAGRFAFLADGRAGFARRFPGPEAVMHEG